LVIESSDRAFDLQTRVGTFWGCARTTRLVAATS